MYAEALKNGKLTGRTSNNDWPEFQYWVEFDNVEDFTDALKNDVHFDRLNNEVDRF